MLVQDKGVISGSEEFHLEPSPIAEKLLYYVTDCGIYFCEYGYRVERENYGNYMLLYVTKGVLAVSTEGTTYLVQEGQVAFFNCHVHHAYYAKGYVSFLRVHFDGANTADFYNCFASRMKGIVFEVNQADEIYKQMTAIVSRYQNHQTVNEEENSGRLYHCLCTLVFAEHKKSDNENGVTIVSKAKEYIHCHMGEELSLGVVAGSVGLSTSHFSRIFKKETQYSPYEYIILVRINKAKHLLTTTDMPIKEIAFEVGYRSESNFCNSFMQREGISPIQFRRYHRM